MPSADEPQMTSGYLRYYDLSRMPCRTQDKQGHYKQWLREKRKDPSAATACKRKVPDSGTSFFAVITTIDFHVSVFVAGVSTCNISPHAPSEREGELWGVYTSYHSYPSGMKPPDIMPFERPIRQGSALPQVTEVAREKIP
ncbi:hypothetical protein NMY22_g17104 [Coprinellus aureogranulatus]|nr:hypothetical protein NMY22_g17104 [Coprinellus aureogranulatus]